MANVIRTMKDVDGNTVFPRTYAQAVTIGDGSVNLEGALSNRPEKPSLLPAKTTLANTDLVTIEGTGGVVNKMTVGKLKELLGISSGGIVESGSGPNGSYIKYADGTMICYRNLIMDDWVKHASGALFSTSSKTWTFPVPFVLTPTVTSQVSSMIPNTWASLGAGGTNQFDTSVRVMGTVIDGSAQYIPSVSLIAIGRWK